MARRVGVHRHWVNRWAQELAKGGRPALKQAPSPAAPHNCRRWTKHIEQGLKRGPKAWVRTGLWMAWRVADLIECECGEKYSAIRAWRVLRAPCWSPQRPAGRALEWNEAAIR